MRIHVNSCFKRTIIIIIILNISFLCFIFYFILLQLGRTALIKASATGYLDIVRTLLKYGAEVKEKDNVSNQTNDDDDDDDD
jgi:ankyrin repeat protein